MTAPVRFARPGRSVLDAALAAAEPRALTYPDVGMTDGDPPAGYRVVERSVVLGSGSPTFERATAALRNWAMFDLPWVLLYPDRPEIRTGLTVVVAGRTLGVWTLNPARVVTTFADHDQIGFAYGTVEGHAAVGEERFEVSLDASGEVRYRIAAYSRLEHPLIRAAGPLARRIQDRFTTGSLAAMHRAVRL